MKISVQLLTWNGEKYIHDLLASLRAQSHSEWELHVLDNGSADQTANRIREDLESHPFPIPFTFDQNHENTGFAPGHNQLFELYGKEADLVILVNQDLLPEPDCLQVMDEFMEKEHGTASCSPRLMQWEDRSRIDSLGLKLFRNGRGVDWLCGSSWEENRPEKTGNAFGEIEVFGVSGAFACLRVEALRELPGPGPIFNPAFFAYKEDVDLAWKFRLTGWKSHTLLNAVAYHDRSAAGTGNQSDLSAAKHWRSKPRQIRELSYRNHLFVVLQYMDLTLPVVWYQLKKAIFLLFWDPGTIWYAVRQLWTSGDEGKPGTGILETRRRLKRMRKAQKSEIKQWLT